MEARTEVVMFPDSLDAYLNLYGPLLAEQSATRSRPLHTPGVDEVVPTNGLLRNPFEAQVHCITAICRAWDHMKGVMVSADCGTGKIIKSIIVKLAFKCKSIKVNLS